MGPLNACPEGKHIKTNILSAFLWGQSLPEMEARLHRISMQLSEQMELQNSSALKTQLAEQQVQDLREKLQGLETELLSADVQREELTHSKQHVSKVTGQDVTVTIGCKNHGNEDRYALNSLDLYHESVFFMLFHAV